MRARFADVAENKNTGRPISAVTVDVFAQGTTTPISETIYVGPTGSDVLANPFTGGSDGEIEFWLAAPVAVDVRYTKTGFTTETKTVVANPPAIPLTDKGAANGVATLDGSGLVPGAQLPALAINETFVVNSQAAMLALTAQRGDMAVRTDLAQTFVLTADAPTVLANWVALETPSGTTAAIATEAALRTAADALLIPLAQRAAANGVATLDASSTVPDAQIPATIARDAETTAAVAAEATIRAAADTAEAAARATAVSTEATLRAAGDAAEIAARTAAISALNGTYVLTTTSGTLAARPAASVVGQTYLATDVAGGTLYESLDGSTWTQVAAGATALSAAASITNTPAGNIIATNVQAAINELDTKKAALQTRTAAYNMSMGGTDTNNSQSDINQRFFIRPTVTASRWRIKLSNYDTKINSPNAAMDGQLIYYGEHALTAAGEGTGNFVAAPTQLVGSAFTIPGNGTQYTSAWFDGTTYPLVAGKDYVISVGATHSGSTAIVRGYNTSSIGLGSGKAATAGTQTPNYSVFVFSFFDAQIEYEFTTQKGTVGLFIGDSLTECFGGDATLGHYSYRQWAHVAATMGGNAAIVNAIAGSVTADWTAGTDNKWTHLDLATYAPDYAVLFLGSNDANTAVTLATYQANITTILGTLRTTYGIKRIYLCTIMPRGLAGANETLRGTYNTWLRAAPLNSVGMFDFDRVTRDPASLAALHADYAYTDNVHLSRAGYAALAQVSRVPVKIS